MSIESVYKLGDDALANMAELTLSVFPLFASMADDLKFRTTQITVPDFAVGSYDVHWKSQHFTKPNGKDETSKEFQTTFRVDKYYTVYKALMAWWQYICNSSTGAMAEDVGAITGTSNIRTDILVRAVDSEGVTTNEGFHFKKCWLKQLSGFSYDQSSGDPLTCTCTWNFVSYIPVY